MMQRGDQLCTSVFTVGEILTGAYKTGRQKEALQIRKYFESDVLRLLPFDLNTADRYATVRAKNKVSPADAIHLATAAQAGVDVYFTNDGSLKKLVVSGIDFIAGLDGSIL
jgi:predicted nucleic acid-binding protein